MAGVRRNFLGSGGQFSEPKQALNENNIFDPKNFGVYGGGGGGHRHGRGAPPPPPIVWMHILKVDFKKIGTGGFFRITSEIGIESQQTWYLRTPWPKWYFSLPKSVLFVSGPGLILRFRVPPRKFDFFRKSKIKNVETGLHSPRH